MFGAMFASLQSLITGHGPIYFEVVSILLVVYGLGKAIGAHSRTAALTSTRHWTSRTAIVPAASILPAVNRLSTST